MVAPDAGVAVGLQLHAHGQAVELRLRAAAARRLELREAPGELLYMVRDLVRDYVCLGEVARRAEALMQRAEGERVLGRGAPHQALR